MYSYPTLYPGTLVKRYKRFLADIELDTGEMITAHCPNTGPMTGVCQIGARVLVSYHDNPQRKLKYTWESIEVESTNELYQGEKVWVGINTALPNKLIKIALEQHLFPELGKYQNVRSEVVYGQNNRSRVDFLLTGGDCPIYLEVKNTTWSIDDVAVFPDTVTTRGQKHLQELTDLLSLPDKYRAVMLYLINRHDLAKFSPGDTTDPFYGELLRIGVTKGLEVLPCRFKVTPEGVSYLGLAELIL